MEDFSTACGGRGKCSKCGQMFNNVAYHESICGKEADIWNGAGGHGKCSICGKEVDMRAYHEACCSMPLLRDKLANDLNRPSLQHVLRIKELEEENKKLKNTVRILSERLSKTSRKMHKIQDDSYDDITPDRDDYR